MAVLVLWWNVCWIIGGNWNILLLSQIRISVVTIIPQCETKLSTRCFDVETCHRRVLAICGNYLLITMQPTLSTCVPVLIGVVQPRALRNRVIPNSTTVARYDTYFLCMIRQPSSPTRSTESHIPRTAYPNTFCSKIYHPPQQESPSMSLLPRETHHRSHGTVLYYKPLIQYLKINTYYR